MLYKPFYIKHLKYFLQDLTSLGKYRLTLIDDSIRSPPMKVDVNSRYGTSAGSFEIHLTPESHEDVNRLNELDQLCRKSDAKYTGWTPKRKKFVLKGCMMFDGRGWEKCPVVKSRIY